MYSKYIFNSNWSSLSSSYRYDDNFAISNSLIPVDGNLNITFSNYLSNVKDFSNNNYSFFFLTDKKDINSVIKKNIPFSTTNKSQCLIAYNLINYQVSENTRFLKFFNRQVFFNGVVSLDNYNFFEIEFLNESFLIIKRKSNNLNYYIAIDNLSTSIATVTSTNDNLTFFEIDKIKLNYILDEDRIVIYKNIQNTTYFISIDNVLENLVLSRGSLDFIPSLSKFSYVRIGSIPSSIFNIDLFRYSTAFDKNNLNIDTTRSLYSIENNYLIHSEYNKKIQSEIGINLLTLKNQLDISDGYTRIDGNNSIRNYTGIFTGGPTEEGSQNISLNYKSNYYPLILKADKTTWFHIPYNPNNKKLNINESFFAINGAVAGSAPIYSDKIWKKIANYSTSSNYGNATDSEQTGRWLCSWLSGNNVKSIWMDRYYNPNTFTPYEALKFNVNVKYVSETNKVKKTGITDSVSELTLENGVWYAYSHMGKKTSMSILSGLKSLFRNRFDSFKNKTNDNVLPTTDEDGILSYNFNGSNYATFETPKSNFGNFTISFFATKRDWNVSSCYNVLGNYLDSGFGIINNNKFNPFIYYINDKKLTFYNNDYEKVTTIDTDFYLSGEQFSIKGLFRKDFLDNFHIITSNFKILEFNVNGSLVDKKDFSEYNLTNNTINSFTNNRKVGIMNLNDSRILQLDLYSNTFVPVFSTKQFNILDNAASSYSGPGELVTDNYDNIYRVFGYRPILKGSNIYFLNYTNNVLKVYSTADNTVNNYLSGNGEILSYSFDKNEFTYLLYKDKVEIFNDKGDFVNNISFNTLIKNSSAVNIAFQNLLNNNYATNIQLVDSSNNNYLLNLNSKNFKRIDNNYNSLFNSVTLKNSFDITNNNYLQSVIDTLYPLPSYNFKVRLFNQLNFEDTRVLNFIVLGETLNTGTHHFAITFDTINGKYSLYIDSKLYSTRTFAPRRYSFANLLTNNFVVGDIPFYNGSLFNDFYKSKTINLKMDDLLLEKFKVYNEALNDEDVKLLYYEKYPPLDISVQLNIGERNYLDTISRVFRHKLQGSKSNLVNLYINNSLISEKFIQEMYNNIIIKELKDTLPSHVKINKIIWNEFIDIGDKMKSGNYSLRNSLTNTEDET